MKKVVLILIALFFIAGNVFAQTSCPSPKPGCSTWDGDMNIKNGDLTVDPGTATLFGPNAQYLLNDLSDACDSCTGTRNVGFGGANSVINAFYNTGSGINDGTVIVLDRYRGSADSGLTTIEDVQLNDEISEIVSKGVTNNGGTIQKLVTIRTFVDSINGGSEILGGRLELHTAEANSALRAGLIIDDEHIVDIPYGLSYSMDTTTGESPAGKTFSFMFNFSAVADADDACDEGASGVGDCFILPDPTTHGEFTVTVMGDENVYCTYIYDKDGVTAEAVDSDVGDGTGCQTVFNAGDNDDDTIVIATIVSRTYIVNDLGQEEILIVRGWHD